MDAVIATWQAGGGAQVAFGLGRLLAAGGHRVRIFAPAADAPRVAAAGCVHRPLPRSLELDPGLRAEEQRNVLMQIFFGRDLADAVAAELAGDPCDVVIVDYLMRTLAGVAETWPAAHALLVHTIYGFHGGRDDDAEATRRWYEPVNAARRDAGLDELPAGPDSVTVALIRRSAGAIVALPRELDDWPGPPHDVVHAGSIVEAPASSPWASPWSSADTRPLVVVSLGSQYMNQEQTLRRIIGALAELPVRGLVLTGNELDPASIPGARDVVVEDYVPHDAVLPHASLVVTHAGTGTLIAAFAHGLPVLCMPLGRDQSHNARRVEELGLGRVLAPDSSSAEIRAAIGGLLGATPERKGASRMATAIARYGDGGEAVAFLERVSAGHPGSATGRAP